jgi:hypothetical protein
MRFLSIVAVLLVALTAASAAQAYTFGGFSSGDNFSRGDHWPMASSD